MHPGCGRNAAQVGGDRQLLPSAGRSHSAAKQRQRGCSGPAATATEPLGLAAHRRGSSAVTIILAGLLLEYDFMFESLAM